MKVYYLYGIPSKSNFPSGYCHKSNYSNHSKYSIPYKCIVKTINGFTINCYQISVRKNNRNKNTSII